MIGSLIIDLVQLSYQLLIVRVVVELFRKARLVSLHIFQFSFDISLLLIEYNAKFEKCIPWKSDAGHHESVLAIQSQITIIFDSLLDCRDVEAA